MKSNFLLVLIFFMLSIVHAQSVCDNEDFEYGNTNVWSGSTGSVNSSGVTLNTTGIVNGRHTIMSGAGFDPIALGCGINVPVVCPGGSYSLRLGNSGVGKQAEAISKVINVTPQNTYFFYKYAVILNDPSGHSLNEKPRFEVRVYDSNGNVIPCGEYIVKATSSIPGFVNCGNWRIRDWTSAGLDLSAYLGQSVTVEFLTTDCTQGGHAGYAYIDASCQDLELLGAMYCPDSTVVELTAPEGFDSYLWNTGESTRIINYLIPIVGDTVSVYMVNDITGCGTELIDTFKVAPEMTVSKPLDTIICIGDTIEFDITGNHVLSYSWPNLGVNNPYIFDTPAVTNTYHYIVVDSFNCFYIHDSIEVSINPLEITLKPTPVTCYGFSDGIAQVNYSSGYWPITFVWDSGTSNVDLINQEAGSYYVTVTDSVGCDIDTFITIGTPTEVTLSATKIDLLCYNDNDGNIDISVNGGVPNYTFAWSNGSLTEDVNNLTSGNYIITITDDNGCVKDTSIIIDSPDEVLLSAIKTDLLCYNDNDGIIDLSVIGGVPSYSFSWSNGALTEDINSLIEGNYIIAVTDDNGCVKDTSITIDSPDEVLLSAIKADLLCYKDSDGTIDLSVIGGVPSYSFSWSNGLLTEDINNLIEGNYIITVTDDNGCVKDTSIAIDSPDEVLLSAIKTDLLCYNDNDGTIDLSVIGGVQNYSFSWSNGSLTEDVNNLIGGYYSVTITDHNSCVKDTSIFISEPLILDIGAFSNPDYCNQNVGNISLTVLGGIQPYAYNWTPTLANSSIVNNLSSGNYNIQIVDSNLCVIDTDIVIQNIPPPSASFTYSDVCEDSLVALMGAAPGSNIINWNWDLGDGRTNSGQNQSITYPQNGSYNISMEVIDAHNCTTTVQNPIDIYPNPVVSFVPDTVWGCEELEVSFQDLTQTDSGSQYLWTFEDHGTSSQQSPIVTFSGVGQYGVGLTVESPYGCLASDYIYNLIEIFSDPIAEFDVTPQSLDILYPLAEFTDLSTDAFTWSWTFGDGGSSSIQHPQYSYSDTGTYNIKLIVTTENFCVDSFDRWITVKPDYILHVPNAFTPNGDLLNDVFLPIGIFTGIDEYRFSIFNRWGELILENYDVNEGWNGGYYNDLGQMSQDGVYVYTISVRDLYGVKNELKGTVVLLR